MLQPDIVVTDCWSPTQNTYQLIELHKEQKNGQQHNSNQLLIEEEV